MAVKRWNGTAWEVYAGADLAPVKVTDGRPGKTTFIGATSPTGQVDGDIWIDQDTTTNAVVPTALTTKGDTFVATGNAAYTRLAAGNNGETLFADSSTSTGLRWQGDFNTGKNKFLNADFSIWQRGTSFSNPSANAYLADRFSLTYNGTGATRTISRQTFTPGTAPVAGYESQFFLRYDQSVAGSGGTFQSFRQFIEDVRTFAGQTITLSYWAKAASAVTLAAPLVRQHFGSGGSANNDDLFSSGASLTTSWQRFSHTITVDSVAGKTIGAGSFLQISLGIPFNTTFTIDFWGVQLEAGSVATEFTTNTGNQQAELAACQRYYEQSFAVGTAPSTSAVGVNTSHTYHYPVNPTRSFSIFTPFKVTKRVPPSIVTYSTTNIGAVTGHTFGVGYTNITWGINDIGVNYFSGELSATSYNEILMGWTASAEL